MSQIILHTLENGAKQAETYYASCNHIVTIYEHKQYANKSFDIFRNKGTGYFNAPILTNRTGTWHSSGFTYNFKRVLWYGHGNVLFGDAIHIYIYMLHMLD